MLYHIYVEKKPEFAIEANSLLSDAKSFLGISTLENVRIINRYFVENITKELFEIACTTIFSEPQIDIVSRELDFTNTEVFAVEYLPGQFDQRADSAMQCLQLISCGESPTVNSSKIYMLYGNLKKDEVEKIKNYVVNPVESRQASLAIPDTIITQYAEPEEVKNIEDFLKFDEKNLLKLIKDLELAMDFDDLKMCQDYFKAENRNPSITEIKVIDTYWSDHCRHTTFNTIIQDVSFEDKRIEATFKDYLNTRKELGRTKPVTLMDLGTIVAKHLKKEGKLDKLDESDEINACTVKVDVNVDGKSEPYLLLFKNETHNHPTEIEPFGGAATCVGGAIRDPLSGRSYVYGAIRLTGSGNPLTPIQETLKGKLPQRKIATGSASGYSSYGNQIGLATGIVDEIYHEGYKAKHMEIGAVIAATPAGKVVRKKPEAGDVVVLLGGKTGRDGIGGATGSSKSHDVNSVETCGAEVQKGNAPEERKIQRLFRNEEVCKMIKKCNDFGAGGVSVAIGELADGLEINLNAVPKKYEGLNATELALSESQERMAIVIERKNLDRFVELAIAENLLAIEVATIKDEPYLSMSYNGKYVVNIKREFLDTNGAKKYADFSVQKAEIFEKELKETFTENYKDLLSDLNICSKKGLSERFDSTIGTGAVTMPFGGKYQLTPVQAMVQKISVEKGDTTTCSLMSWGYNPFITEKSPYHGAYMAVVESLCKLVASGAEFKDVYLSFQEYFEKMKDKYSFGKPLAALLGAFKAQMDFGVAAIGGKDSMSGTFENLSVPPTLVSFAVTTEEIDNILTPEFKEAGRNVVLLAPAFEENGLPSANSDSAGVSILEKFDRLLSAPASLTSNFAALTKLARGGKIASASAVGFAGLAEAVFKAAIGNGYGFKFDSKLTIDDLFKVGYGSFLLELVDTDVSEIENAILVGKITEDKKLTYKDEELDLTALLDIYESVLELVYTSKVSTKGDAPQKQLFTTKEFKKANIKIAKPKVLIPVFMGTNCEYDSQKAFETAGADTEFFIVNNLNSDFIQKSIENFAKKIDEAQIIFLPGGFSAGDEPDGSGKFITAFFRNDLIKEKITNFLDSKDGLMAGICNGFQALIKLGLVPYGKIVDTDASCPTLTFNTIGRHQSKIVRTMVTSNKSPWLSSVKPGDVFSVPISHGEGRFIADDETVKKLFENGQIATQYVDFGDNPSMDIEFNPNGSVYAIEGITSPDGRVFGKMGHSERIGYGLYKNVIGNYDLKMFSSAINYFR